MYIYIYIWYRYYSYVKLKVEKLPWRKEQCKNVVVRVSVSSNSLCNFTLCGFLFAEGTHYIDASFLLAAPVQEQIGAPYTLSAPTNPSLPQPWRRNFQEFVAKSSSLYFLLQSHVNSDCRAEATNVFSFRFNPNLHSYIERLMSKSSQSVWKMYQAEHSGIQFSLSPPHLLSQPMIGIHVTKPQGEGCWVGPQTHTQKMNDISQKKRAH